MLSLALLAAACSQAPGATLRPVLPKPCDLETLDGRSNIHRYEHCLEQMTERVAAAPMTPPAENCSTP